MGRLGASVIIRKQDKNFNQVQEQVPHTAEPAVKDHVDDSGYYMQLESRGIYLTDILETLESEKFWRVALYGLGGVGKTTLARQVGKRAKECNIFNRVVFVNVASNPTVKKIQGDIAAGLGLRLEEVDDVAARKRQISQRLRNKEERVLIILDEVWTRIDLQEIGILNEGSHMGCKLLLTSRSRQVGQVLDCDALFSLYLLTEEESWYLFKKHAGIYDGSPDLTSLAKEVAKLCKGLPLAISLLGSALRGKTVERWRQVLEELSPFQYHDEIHRIIELCYDAISSQVAKTLLVIGALFPRYHEILIEDLSLCAIRLGVCKSKNEATAATNTLMDSCFLIRSDQSNDHVVMHYLVQEIAVYRVMGHSYKNSVYNYMYALYHEEDFQWQEELDRLLRLLFGVREYPSSSTSNETCYGRELRVGGSYSYTIAAATLIPKPSGKLVDFKGMCKVDKSFLALLKKAYETRPQVIKSMSKHPERGKALECLGWVLFLLSKVKEGEWVDVNLRRVLQVCWGQLKTFECELGWLSPSVEGVLSSEKIANIESLKKEERLHREQVARLRQQLETAERYLADVRAKITLAESQLGGFPIAGVMNARPTPIWKKPLLKIK